MKKAKKPPALAMLAKSIAELRRWRMRDRAAVRLDALEENLSKTDSSVTALANLIQECREALKYVGKLRDDLAAFKAQMEREKPERIEYQTYLELRNDLEGLRDKEGKDVAQCNATIKVALADVSKQLMTVREDVAGKFETLQTGLVNLRNDCKTVLMPDLVMMRLVSVETAHQDISTRTAATASQVSSLLVNVQTLAERVGKDAIRFDTGFNAIWEFDRNLVSRLDLLEARLNRPRRGPIEFLKAWWRARPR